jgi:hypothetical protein
MSVNTLKQYDNAVDKVLNSSLKSLDFFTGKKKKTDDEIINESFKVKARTQVLNSVARKLQIQRISDKKAIPLIAEKKNGVTIYKKK